MFPFAYKWGVSYIHEMVTCEKQDRAWKRFFTIDLFILILNHKKKLPIQKLSKIIKSTFTIIINSLLYPFLTVSF